MYIIVPLVIVSLHQLVASIVISVVLDYGDFRELTLNRLMRSQWVWVDIVLYFIMSAGINLLDLQERSRILSINNSRLKSQLYTLQLEVLRNQLQPHFLFNTLNTLSTLILKKDNEGAQWMLQLIKRFLKTTVQDNLRHYVRLSEELSFIKDYLEIERVRFKDKMELVMEIRNDVRQAIVPGFILQPIVENAVHHAIAQGKENGIIKINALRDADDLKIIVEDNGPGFSGSKSKKSGIGLKITEERLQYSYQNNYGLSFENSELGGLKLVITIPFQDIFDTTQKTILEYIL